MLVWGLVKAGLGTLTEIETSWCFSDIMKARAVLQYESDVEYRRSKRKGPQK